MILSVTLSNPTSRVEELLGKKYVRAKIRFNASSERPYYAEFFTKTQSFHKNWTQDELEKFLLANIGAAFCNCVERTEEKEIYFFSNKSGKVKKTERPLDIKASAKSLKKQTVEAESDNPSAKASRGKTALAFAQDSRTSLNSIQDLKAGGACQFFLGKKNEKNYIIKEGSSVPFLQALGVMTDRGKVVASKYGKFRQINRFLELLDDVLPALLKARSQGKETGISQDFSQAQNGGGQVDAPIQILDFGSGKSYLTFAVQYFMEKIKKIPCQITGVDLKEDVVENCSDLARRLEIQNINFVCGDIASYNGKNPDIVIALHACDTATDYALSFAVKRGAKAIMCVPCCQKEINSQLSKNSNADFDALLKHGILRERFSALVTDAVRAWLLEKCGYKVQVLEFIDMEGTPKNLMIRATLKEELKAAPFSQETVQENKEESDTLSPFKVSGGGDLKPKLLEKFGAKQKFLDLLLGE